MQVGLRILMVVPESFYWMAATDLDNDLYTAKHVNRYFDSFRLTIFTFKAWEEYWIYMKVVLMKLISMRWVFRTHSCHLLILVKCLLHLDRIQGIDSSLTYNRMWFLSEKLWVLIQTKYKEVTKNHLYLWIKTFCK